MRKVFSKGLIGFVSVIIVVCLLSNTAFAATPNVNADCNISNSAEVILAACKGRATVQDDRGACLVSIDSHNPYDVIWDYGEKYKKFVELCDWSLVFDPEYYKTAYPMLAVLYNKNDALLLEHFQTVGVHEGRQGNNSFNVEAYLKNCDYNIYKTFKSDVEGAYIYYMLHYDSESQINTITCKDGREPRTQLFNIYTVLQQTELNHINKYREKAGSDDVVINGELCALANYRAYINRVNGVTYGHAHDWLNNNIDLAWKYIGYVDEDARNYGENAITSGKYLVNVDFAYKYYNSPEHYECMIDPGYTMVGVSNAYYSPDTGKTSQLDVYIY